MLLTCRHVRQLHDAYIDGELSPSLMAEMHAHLLQCPECQQEVEMTRACGTVIGMDRSESQLDSGFASRVVAAMPKPAASTGPVVTLRPVIRARRWRAVLSIAVPAAAAVLFLSVLIWPPLHPEGGPRLVAGKAVEAAGVAEVVNPTLGAMADTRQAAASLNQLIEIAGGDAGRKAAAELREAETQEIAVWEEVIFGSIRVLLEAKPPPPPPGKNEREVVRF